MLTKIELYNFLSFKGKTVVDFTKTNYKFFEDTHTKNGITKGAVFVGGNASGKSNILVGLQILNAMLFEENFFSNANHFKCMLTDETYFYAKFSFLINNIDIEYYVRYDIETRVIKEILKLDDKEVLRRLGDNAELFLNPNKEEIFDKENVVSDILFLRTHYYNTKFNNNKHIELLIDKLNTMISIDLQNKRILGKYNKNLDINRELNEDRINTINKFFEDINYNFRVKLMENKLINDKIVVMNRVGANFALPIQMESTGNKILHQVILPFVFAVENNGILIIDEFSSGFHNELEELLIRYFLENTESGQIFITTHSTNILSNKLLRPDQMYAVEHTVERGSSVKRFSDEQPRLSQNTEKMYESGVFGGLPRYDRD